MIYPHAGLYGRRQVPVYGKKNIFSLIDNVIKANELNYISRGMVIADINSYKRTWMVNMPKRILIVDDHALSLLGLSRALKVLCDFHGEIKPVMSGREAIREAGLYFYNICFLDITLPDISGIEVMKKINEISPETDIVIMSACFICDEIKKAIDENASLFISKPFDLTEIKAFMKHVFKGDLDFTGTGKLADRH